MTWTNSATAEPHPGAATAKSRHDRPVPATIPVSVQVFVAILAMAVRFAAPGWLLLFTIFGGEVIGLLPLIIATIIGVLLLRKAAQRARTIAIGLLAAMDLSLLVFALTLPDITDSEDVNFVPLVTLTRQEHTVSGNLVADFQAIAAPAAWCYVLFAPLMVCLGALTWSRRGRATVR
ncbi:hypothetical protein KO481_26330 [Nocardia sp. NEAU-G5]|uniref:Uncharacterized protein n=1 Tax=Nocardia albiluteola TaxID=2842303 RepID=A0ABS6B6Q4_9NOCA|nr:hypothetical protein [Nocardia albiluteola]MBU3065035.1 hypothetical protein [Nocardia albiluteola]